MAKRFLSLLMCLLILAPVFPEHPWKAKRVAFLGDSITDPKNKSAKKHYWHYLQEWFGITPFVFAVSGRQWNDIPKQATQLKEKCGDDIDGIIIFIGTNDYNAGIPIGEWFTTDSAEVLAARHKDPAMVKRLHRKPIKDKNTFRGRINIALDSIKRLYPTKQIVLMTPLHRASANFGKQNIQPSEDYQNSCGEWVDAYIESVKQAGNIWAVPVIDLNADSGLYPLFDEYTQYFGDSITDRLHPNDKGHIRLAKTIWQRLSALPCDFTN